MPLYLVEEGIEGVQFPPSIIDKAPMVGPASKVYRGIKSARRVTQSNSPVVWIVEGSSLLLEATGNEHSE